MPLFRIDTSGERLLQGIREDLIRARALHAASGEEGPARIVVASREDGNLADLATLMGVIVVDDLSAGEPAGELTTAWREAGLSVGVLLASHNYREFLTEAVDSLLRQTYRPDQILISDDASTDGSADLIRENFAHLPGVEVRLGEKNLGIEAHFNEAISMLSTDVVIILGADNRFPPHYVQRCLEVLVADPSLGIAYTDFAYFGSLAADAHSRLPKEFRGAALSETVYLSCFPGFDDAARETLFAGKNFIHGSSAYRRSAFDAVGGYGSRTAGPEDWRLFKRILTAGFGARKVENCYLEYRQHSDDQANMQFAFHWELGKLRSDVLALREEALSLRESLEASQEWSKKLETDVHELREALIKNEAKLALAELGAAALRDAQAEHVRLLAEERQRGVDWSIEVDELREQQYETEQRLDSSESIDTPLSECFDVWLTGFGGYSVASV